MRLPATLFVLVSLLDVAAAAEPTPVHPGDRIRVRLEPSGGEAGLALDLLEGTRLDVKARADGLEPRLRLFGPTDREIPLPGRRSSGSAKVKVKRVPVNVTGRYLLVVTEAAGRTGEIRVKLRARRPGTIRDDGRLAGPGQEDAVRFPAFEGTVLRAKVRGRKGLVPSLRSITDPERSEDLLQGARLDGAKARHDGWTSDVFGDHRLWLGATGGTTGEWRAKLKLRHPEARRRDLVVTGHPAGTFTEDKLPPDVPDVEPPGRDVEPVVVETDTFRIRFEIVTPPPDPERPHVRLLGEDLDLRVSITNITSSPIAVVYWGPTGEFLIRGPNGFVETWPVPAVVITYTHGPNETLVHQRRWDTAEAMEFHWDWIPMIPGEYEAFTIWGTSDSRVPKVPGIKFRFE